MPALGCDALHDGPPSLEEDVLHPLGLSGHGRDGVHGGLAALHVCSPSKKVSPKVHLYTSTEKMQPAVRQTLFFVDSQENADLARPSTWSGYPPGRTRVMAVRCFQRSTASTTGPGDVPGATAKGNDSLWNPHSVKGHFRHSCRKGPFTLGMPAAVSASSKPSSNEEAASFA